MQNVLYSLRSCLLNGFVEKTLFEKCVEQKHSLNKTIFALEVTFDG